MASRGKFCILCYVRGMQATYYKRAQNGLNRRILFTPPAVGGLIINPPGGVKSVSRCAVKMFVASFLEIDLSKVDSCAIVWQSCIVVCITPDNHTTLLVVDCLHHA